MAGTIISNFMMFLPRQTQMFCLIGLAVAIFGIYIPYEEHKKKRKKSAPKKSAPIKRPLVKTPENRGRLEQLETLRKAGLLTEEEYQEKKREMKV